MLDKFKSRVGLNKKKVNSSDGNSSSSNNNISDISNGNGNINKNGNTHGTKIHSDNGRLHNSKETDIDDNVEYIGQGVLASWENNSEMGLAVDSQKQSHTDSDSVDSVDGNTFAVPDVPTPSPF